MEEVSLFFPFIGYRFRGSKHEKLSKKGCTVAKHGSVGELAWEPVREIEEAPF
jgi:hypothetical protein